MILGISGRAGSGKDLTGKIIQYLTCNDDSQKHKFEDTLNWIQNKSVWQVKKFAYAVKQICSILTGIPVDDFEKEEVKSSYLGEEWNKLHILSVFKGTHREWNEFIKLNSSNKSFFISDQAPSRIGNDRNVYYYFIDQRITIRELLQKVGTDAMRDVIHPDVWVIALMKDYKPYIEGYPKLIKSNGVDLVAGQTYSIGKAVNPNWIISDVHFENECKAIKDRQGIVIRVNRYPKTIIIDNVERVFDKGSDVCLKEYSKGHISETSLDNYTFDYVIENDSDIPSLIEKVREMLIYFKLL